LSDHAWFLSDVLLGVSEASLPFQPHSAKSDGIAAPWIEKHDVLLDGSISLYWGRLSLPPFSFVVVFVS
jgi:hypothetical protein